MMSIKQGKDESLRNYVSRFDKEILQVLNPGKNILTFTFRQGLNSDKPESEALKFSKQWTYLKTMKEVMEYAQSHVDVEDFKAITGSMHQEQKGKSSNKARKPAERSGRGKKMVRTKDLDVPGLHNYADYTPLKESRVEIFNVHIEDTKWQRPTQRKMVGKNPGAFCKFHECLGQWAEHCKSLMNNIEDLIHRGYFQQYKQERGFGKRQSGSGS